MSKIRKRLGAGAVILVLALVLLATGQSSQSEAASSNGWRRCGEFYLIARNPPVLFLTKGIPCIPALEVVAQAIVEPGIITCLEDGCQARGFNCAHPNSSKTVLITCKDEVGRELTIKARPR